MSERQSCAAAGCEAGDESAAPVGEVMLALGDSLAVGIGAAHVSEGAMALLADRLRSIRPTLRLLNLGVPSQASTDILAPGGQLERAERAIAAALDRGETVAPVTMSIGANDAMEADTIGEEEAVRLLAHNLGTIFTRLDAALRPQGFGLAEAGWIQTFYNPFAALHLETGLPSADDLAPRRARRTNFNEAIRSAALRHGVRVADVGAAFAGRELQLTWVRTGDIHPNPLGHETIASVYLGSCEWRPA